MVTQELIDKFFRNECTDDERRQVLQYFEQDPQLWDKYLNEEDWEAFQTNERLHPAVTGKIFDNVSKRTYKKNRTWLALAASMVLLAGIAWVLIAQQGPVPTNGTAGSETVLNEELWRERTNTSGKEQLVTLEDGTQVTLWPNSSLRYYNNFYTNNKRTVYLQGKGLFKVARDANHPFTVYADAVATTALGTEFTVSSFKDSHEIRVALHEGKVVVGAGNNKKQYLLPGDELTYNKNTMLASVKRASAPEQLVKAGASLNKGVIIQKPEWYKFDGGPLADVLDQLSAYYQVDIYYYPADIRNKYFTAAYRKYDSLDRILNDIALLNRLSIVKKPEGYIIRKAK